MGNLHACFISDANILLRFEVKLHLNLIKHHTWSWIREWSYNTIILNLMDCFASRLFHLTPVKTAHVTHYSGGLLGWILWRIKALVSAGNQTSLDRLSYRGSLEVLTNSTIALNAMWADEWWIGMNKEANLCGPVYRTTDWTKVDSTAQCPGRDLKGVPFGYIYL